MRGDDLEITRSIIKGIERMFEDIQNKHLSKTRVAQAIGMLCQCLLRLEEELILPSEETIMEIMRAEGEHAPECETCLSIGRLQRNGDECRVDFRLEENEGSEKRIIWLMREFCYGIVDPDIYKWQVTTDWFYDEDPEEFMECEASMRVQAWVFLSINQERSESYNWQGFFIEESIAVALVGDMLDIN